MRDVHDKPVVKFSEVEEVMSEFVSAIKDKNDKAIGKSSIKLMDIINAYVRYYAHVNYPMSHTARAVDDSSSLRQSILLYLLIENRLPKYLAKIRNNPCKETGENCLSFLKHTISLKTKTIPIDNLRKFHKKGHRFICNYEKIIAEDLKVVSPSSQSQKNELLAALDNAIETIFEEDQRLIYLRAFENLTFREIAEEMNILESTITKRYDRVIESLNKALKERGFDNIE